MKGAYFQLELIGFFLHFRSLRRFSAHKAAKEFVETKEPRLRQEEGKRKASSDRSIDRAIIQGLQIKCVNIFRRLKRQRNSRIAILCPK